MRDNIIVLIIGANLALIGWFGNRLFENTLFIKGCLFGLCITPFSSFIISFLSLLTLLILVKTYVK